MVGVFLLLMNIRFTIIILIIISGFSFSQTSSKDFDEQLRVQDSAINSLKGEIANTSKDIQNQQNKAQ
ncbi:MAG: hypothetical protein MUP82_09745, partial [Candidatus Marinimicrobia bacterium]|nr:hypothetical protein [Candidatus Neomarinimicrobiota bacterium]